MRTAVIALVIVTAGLMCGCIKYTRPQTVGQQLAPDQRDFEALWQRSLDVLKDYNFAVDRQDRRAGIITTMPLVARQWFEFWRPDAVSNRDVLEGTVQTIYRTATVRVNPSSAGNYRVTVEIAVSRSDRPQPAIQSVSDAYNMFVLPGGDEHSHGPALGYAMVGQTTPTLAPNSVVVLGKDAALAREISDKISRATAR